MNGEKVDINKIPLGSYVYLKINQWGTTYRLIAKFNGYQCQRTVLVLSDVLKFSKGTFVHKPNENWNKHYIREIKVISPEYYASIQMMNSRMKKMKEAIKQQFTLLDG